MSRKGELGMRKSKLVTIYDLKLTMEWTGRLSRDYELRYASLD